MIKSIIVVFLIAMLPVWELRGAIPFGVFVYNLDPAIVFIVAWLGTLVPVLILLKLWPWLGHALSARLPPLARVLTWIFARTRERFYEKHQRYGDIALFIFVALPLPMTGVWTGSVAAYLFGIPYKPAAGLIAAGAAISGIIVTLASVGVSLLI